MKSNILHNIASKKTRTTPYSKNKKNEKQTTLAMNIMKFFNEKLNIKNEEEK